MTYHNGEDIHYWPRFPDEGETDAQMLAKEITFMHGELAALQRRVKALERRNVVVSVLVAVRDAVRKARYDSGRSHS